MSVRDIQVALRKAGQDDALVNHFITIWPLVESILEAFSKATALPIFGFLDGVKVFQSSMETMPPFCREMLTSPTMATRCVGDGQYRASTSNPQPGRSFRGEVQQCHAGMLNGRCDIDTGSLGTLSILFGSKKAIDGKAVARRESVIRSAEELNDPALVERLRSADAGDENVGDIAPSNIELMNAITSVIERLIATTVGLRSLTINMAHELSLMLLGTGLLALEVEDTIDSLNRSNFEILRPDLQHDGRLIRNQCQLGLYVVRNFLSHASETRYAEVVTPRFTEIDLTELLTDIVDLHRPVAAKKLISLKLADVPLPKVIGSPMELQRLLHNVLSNAIKYSYHSIPEAGRVVRIWPKLPYDPGFAQRRFAIVIENYGLGVTTEELHQVFKAGFRGKQAAAEVLIGSGIGLSEALKIMKVHAGTIKIRSRAVHEAGEGNPTYVTTVELIFPYRDGLR
jgi:signal transduction histidine kinase